MFKHKILASILFAVFSINAKKSNIKAKQTNTNKLFQKNTTNTFSSNPKNILKKFFNSAKTMQGSFLHILSDKAFEKTSAEPIIPKHGHDFSGSFAISFEKPVKFKWKYLFPYVKQIVKNDIHLLYKEGQSVKTSPDGITVTETNKRKPYIIFQSLPITFLFDVPVDTWIEDIDILQTYENKKYFSMELSYKTLQSKGILKQLQTERVFLVFSKDPLCLVQWHFTDQTGKHNQITLGNISINKKLTKQTFEMD